MYAIHLSKNTFIQQGSKAVVLGAKLQDANDTKFSTLSPAELIQTSETSVSGQKTSCFSISNNFNKTLKSTRRWPLMRADKGRVAAREKECIKFFYLT